MAAAELPKRSLGTQGLVVSCQGLGCRNMSVFYSDFNAGEAQEAAMQIIDKALELGCNFLDTSDLYGQELIGRAIKGRRDKFIIATKFGVKINEQGTMQLDSRRSYVREACEASLKRFGIDCIDLFYQLRVDPNTPIEETMQELKALVEEGKIKYIGLSEAGPADIRKAHAIHPISVCQLEWSLWTRDIEEEIVPLLRELGIGIVAYSPLGRGFFTGKLTSPDDLEDGDHRKNNPRFTAENFAKNKALVDKVTEIAKSKGCTPGQIALAWVARQGNDVVPIPGTKRVKYLEENIASVNITLTDDEMKNLDFGASDVHGERYDEAGMSITHSGKKQVAS